MTVAHVVSPAALCPEEAVLTRAAADALAFVADSKTNCAERLWAQTREAASEQSGVEIDDDFLPMWRRVFYASVAALLDWDFATDFQHVPAPT